jgi:tetratricopeptide (TPR) repeat protein
VLPTATSTPEVSPAEALFDQGLALMDQEKWDEAIAAFQEGIRLDPAFAPAYGGLGYSYASKGDFEPAITNLEKFLELAPDLPDRAEIEADIQQMRDALAQEPQFDVPPGKALFVFTNYTNVDWSIDVGPYHMDLPGWTGGEYPTGTLTLDPGTYTWQAHSPGGGYYMTDENGNRSFEFTVAAGEIYGRSVGGPPIER